MAAYSFKNFGWFASGVVGVLGCYLVTSQVAAEKARADAVSVAIIQAHKDIRDLETEFETRANLAQLERYNGEVLALSAPAPQQFLGDETQLASLGAGGTAQVQNAALLVPSGVTPAVVPAPAAAPVTTAAPAPVTAPVQTAAATSAPISRAVRDVIKSGKGQVAMLDRKLLSDTTLGDLMKGARTEASRLR
jgi:hypothetical protein